MWKFTRVCEKFNFIIEGTNVLWKYQCNGMWCLRQVVTATRSLKKKLPATSEMQVYYCKNGGWPLKTF